MRLVLTDHPRYPRFDNADALTHHDRRHVIQMEDDHVMSDFGVTQGFTEDGVRYLWNELQIRNLVPKDAMLASAVLSPLGTWSLVITSSEYPQMPPT